MRPQHARFTPSFVGLRSASTRASAAARGASKKKHTRSELALRRELWKLGLRYRLHGSHLPGCPDIVFAQTCLAVFCDGDFWHGRDLHKRLSKLAQGHNPNYWVAKISRNIERDRANTYALKNAGWQVLRFWETDLLHEAPAIASQIAKIIAKRNKRKGYVKW